MADNNRYLMNYDQVVANSMNLRSKENEPGVIDKEVNNTVPRTHYFRKSADLDEIISTCNKRLLV